MNCISFSSERNLLEKDVFQSIAILLGGLRVSRVGVSILVKMYLE